MSSFEVLRAAITEEIFDFGQFAHVFQDYRKPRDLMSRFLKEGRLLRIRKGLYVFGEKWRHQALGREVLANLVYGPAIVSVDYALAWYGLIPERVHSVTCTTTRRSRIFETPMGRFAYKHLEPHQFSFGFVRQTTGRYGWLIAEPLKALADKLWCDSRFKPVSLKDYESYLFEDLRIDESRLGAYINVQSLKNVCVGYKARKIDRLAEMLSRYYLPGLRNSRHTGNGFENPLPPAKNPSNLLP